MTNVEAHDADGTIEVVSGPTGIVTVEAPHTTIEVAQGGAHVEATTTTTPAPSIEQAPPEAPTITLGQQGPRGPAGSTGPPGPPGPGSGSAFYFVHSQLTPATEWRIEHGLGGRPAVTVADSAGSVAHGDVHYVSDVELVVSFSHPFGGFAYLS